MVEDHMQKAGETFQAAIMHLPCLWTFIRSNLLDADEK